MRGVLLPRSKTRPRSMSPKFQSEEEELAVAKSSDNCRTKLSEMEVARAIGNNCVRDRPIASALELLRNANGHVGLG